jgi:type I restriction enzyme S subunit
MALDDEYLPEGWALAQVRQLVEIHYGKGLRDDRREAGSIRVYGSNGIVGRHSRSLTNGPTIILGRKGSIGAVHFCSSACWPIDTTYYVDSFHNVDVTFLVSALRNLDLSELDTSTAIPGLNRDDIYKQRMALPPLAEQKRLGIQLEHCLNRVNSARDHLSRVPAILKRFRQAVLAAACSGRLTGDVRTQGGLGIGPVVATGEPVEAEENLSELPEGWRWQKLGDMAKVERGRFSVRPRNDPAYYDGRHPFVQIGDLPQNGGEILNFKQSLNERGLAVSKCFPKGTVLIAIVGATIGNTGVLTFDSCCPDSLVAIRAESEAMSRFIEYCLRWKKPEIRSESYASGGQPNINLQTLIPLPVPVPPAHEVEAIVRRVEVLLRLAERIERQIAVANRRCELLEQAILHKAFRGELVPTEAELARREGRDYEPASALLERIKAERKAIADFRSVRQKRRAVAAEAR